MKLEKRSPKSLKNEMFIFGLRSISDDHLMMTNIKQNAKKGPPCHQKIKCSVLDYVQLLMIGQAG